MTRSGLAIAAIAGLSLATVLPTNASASADRPLTPSAAESPKPRPSRPPVVKVDPTKDGVQTSSKGKVGDRLGGSRPPKRTTPKRNSHKPSGPLRTKENVSSDTPERVEIQLNIGLCGRMQPDGTIPGPTRCMPYRPDEPRPSRRTVPPAVVLPRPQDVTWEQILSETKVVLFPKLSVKVQPKDRTLVNLDTIVYTDENKVSTTTVTLLGFPVRVEATPISYTWHFGDGTPALTTSAPGKPYPSKEITHKYMKRGAVNLTLTTNYAARYNVAGTGWQYVDGTVPITGPATPLQVREAVPVLVDPPN